jgi:hypothetical protein
MTTWLLVGLALLVVAARLLEARRSGATRHVHPDDNADTEDGWGPLELSGRVGGFRVDAFAYDGASRAVLTGHLLDGEIESGFWVVVPYLDNESILTGKRVAEVDGREAITRLVLADVERLEVEGWAVSLRPGAVIDIYEQEPVV